MEQPDKKPLPPYLSFTTLTNFVDGLGVNMPTRIDKSLMKSMSGAAQSSLISGLDYLGLKKGEKPTDDLVTLASTQGDNRSKQWDSLIRRSYGFLFADGFDLSRATRGELDERFRTQGVSGSTIGKCVSFFTAAAQVAGITLSPHFKQIKSRAARGTRAAGAKPKRSKGEQKVDQTPLLPPSPPRVDEVLFHPAVDAFLREAKKLTEGDEWSQTARNNVIQGFTTQIDLFLPVKN